jgi:hypothetical protein
MADESLAVRRYFVRSLYLVPDERCAVGQLNCSGVGGGDTTQGANPAFES